MKTRRFGIPVIAAWIAAWPMLSSGYVELSDDEMNRLSAGHGTVEWSQGDSFRSGQIYFVSGFSSNGASYYLYIPSAFDGEADLPALMFMNAARHGLGPLLKWLPSAEDLGWIVAVPHDIGNDGPDNTPVLLREIVRHFRSAVRHDIRRLYVGGVSGGACRAYWQARGFRGEYAGVVDVVGWMCDYDEYVYYPSRLAVVHLNGESYHRKSFMRDDEILHRTGVRTKMLEYDGGHNYPESAIADEALTWLDEDFARNGVRFAFSDAEARATLLMEQAAEASRQGDPVRCATLLLETLSKYAYTTNAFGAEDMLVELLGREDAESLAVAMGAGQDLGALYARMLFQRGQYYDDDAVTLDRALRLSGLAAALDPGNHHALELHARMLMRQPERTRRDVLRARTMLDRAIRLGPGYWLGFATRAELFLLGGALPEAYELLVRAEKPAQQWRDPYEFNMNSIRDIQARVVEEEVRIRSSPWSEYFLDCPTGRVVDVMRSGAYALSGRPEFALSETAAGNRALVLRGPDDLVRYNVSGDLGSNAFVSLMMAPGRGDQPPWGEVYYDDNLVALRLDDAGVLHRRSVVSGQTNWMALQHPPLYSGTWNRIDMAFNFAAGVSRTWVNGAAAAPDIHLPPGCGSLTYVALEPWGAEPSFIDVMLVSDRPIPPDLDTDTLPDAWEMATDLETVIVSGPRSADEAKGPNGDPDGDGLGNLREYLVGTLPMNEDTDGDRMTDGAEIVHGFDPLKADPFQKIALPSGGSFAEVLADAWSRTDDIRMRTVHGVDGKPLAEILPSLGDCQMTRSDAAGPTTVIWLTLTLQPTPGIDVQFTEAMKQGAALVFLNMDGHLVVYDGSMAVRGWVTLDDHSLPLDRVVEIRLRLDYRDKTWSIWHDGQLLADGLGFANPAKADFSTISFEGTGLLDSYHVAAHGPDDDADGVPDDWEWKFFSTLERVGSDTDNDRDGFLDVSEYLSGTDPLDAESRLEIIEISLDGDRLSIVWEAKPENYEGNPISYNLLRSKRMDGGTMAPVAHEIRPNGVLCVYTVSGDPGEISSFYSIEANP